MFDNKDNNNLSLWDMNSLDILNKIQNNFELFDKGYIPLILKTIDKNEIDSIKNSFIYQELIKKISLSDDCLLKIHFIIYFENDLIYELYHSKRDMVMDLINSDYSKNLKIDYLLIIMCSNNSIDIDLLIMNHLSNLLDPDKAYYDIKKYTYEIQ